VSEHGLASPPTQWRG